MVQSCIWCKEEPRASKSKFRASNSGSMAGIITPLFCGIRNAVKMGSLDIVVVLSIALISCVSMASEAPPTAPFETLPPPDTIWANS